MFTTLGPLTASALLLALVSCSRHTAEPRPANEAQSLTPAAASARTASTPNVGPRRCAEHFTAFDEDSDGRVSEQEFGVYPHAHPDPLAVFRERDRDADRSLTRAEFCSGWRGPTGSDARSAEAASGEGPGPDVGPNWGRRGDRGRSSMMGARCEQHFEAFDENDDGVLSADEFGAWPHPHGDAATLFAARDLDHDGKVTRVEFCPALRESTTP